MRLTSTIFLSQPKKNGKNVSCERLFKAVNCAGFDLKRRAHSLLRFLTYLQQLLFILPVFLSLNSFSGSANLTRILRWNSQSNLGLSHDFLFNPRAKFWNYFPWFGIILLQRLGTVGRNVFVVGSLKTVGEYGMTFHKDI